MVIARGRKGAHFAGWIPRRHHADLAFEIERFFHDRGPLSQFPPRFSKTRTGTRNAHLAAPVVAAAPGLHKHVSAQRVHGLAQLRLAPHRAKRPHGKSVLSQPRLLQRLVLNDADRLHAGAQRRQALHHAQRINSNLLDLNRHHIGARGQPPRSVHIVPAAHNGFIGHKARRARGLGIHHAHAIAHGARGHRRHPPQLPAAENGEQSARLYS